MSFLCPLLLHIQPFFPLVSGSVDSSSVYSDELYIGPIYHFSCIEWDQTVMGSKCPLHSVLVSHIFCVEFLLWNSQGRWSHVEECYFETVTSSTCPKVFWWAHFLYHQKTRPQTAAADFCGNLQAGHWTSKLADLVKDRSLELQVTTFQHTWQSIPQNPPKKNRDFLQFIVR